MPDLMFEIKTLNKNKIYLSSNHNLYHHLSLMSKQESSTIEIVKIENNPKSQQAKENTKTVGTRSPKIPFSTLTNLYYDSFIVAGLTDKIATAINSGFKSKDDRLLEVIKKIDQEFLGRNKVLCGNAFFEVIEDGKGMVTDLLPILSNTIEVMEDGDGYRQQVGTDVVYFNAFTPKDKRPERTTIYQESKAGAKELRNTGKGCGYNPNLNQVYHFKNTSLSTKYYGASYFEAVVDQLVLIEYIDTYYTKGFANGMIKAKMIFPKNEKKVFGVEDKNVLKAFLEAKMKGVEKSYSTAILDQEVGQLNLEHEIDAKAFIEYRTQLLQSVAIALNVPYDMLLSDNSNRASSQVSMETFNNFTIIPAQSQNIKDFKILFAEGYKVDDLEYEWIDTTDEKEQMDVLTGYKKAGIMTANEVREKIGLPPIDGGDQLMVDTAQAQKDQLAELMKGEKKEFLHTLTKIENDILTDLQA